MVFALRLLQKNLNMVNIDLESYRTAITYFVYHASENGDKRKILIVLLHGEKYFYYSLHKQFKLYIFNKKKTNFSACPECRIESHYVCPSLYWVDTKEEKEKLINEYKEALRQQHCKYFNKVRCSMMSSISKLLETNQISEISSTNCFLVSITGSR